MKYSQLIQEQRQLAFEAGMQIGFQQAMDFMCMALNDPDCMGAKGVLGGDKIERIGDYAMELDKLYHKAFEPKDPEADVWQERLDAKQKKIFKEKAVSFYGRYPCVKACRYEVKK